MNEPFGDTPTDLPMPPKTWQWYDDLCPDEATMRRKRVLSLAREMMLEQMANPDIHEFHFGNMVRLAESWIAEEDAYVLPE